MKRHRAENRLPSRRSKWAYVTLMFLLAAAVAGLEILTVRPVQAGFTGGPSIRVSPNSMVEIRWVADFFGSGQVDIFDSPNGGRPIDTKVTPPANDQTITFNVGGLLKADTTYYLKVTHSDGIRPDLTNDPAPYPLFFTGVQSIGDVFVDAGVDSARILWDANVIGLGRIEYGTAAPGDVGTIDDQNNTTSHSIQLTGLVPGTTYQYRVCNRHTIDGDCLAAKAGSFTTQATTPQVIQAIDDLRERVASYGLPRGTARSLDAKLEAALAAWQAGDTSGACSALSDFLNEVGAQAGKKLTEAQAQQLTAAANNIRARIGC